MIKRIFKLLELTFIVSVLILSVFQGQVKAASEVAGTVVDSLSGTSMVTLQSENVSDSTAGWAVSFPAEVTITDGMNKSTGTENQDYASVNFAIYDANSISNGETPSPYQGDAEVPIKIGASDSANDDGSVNMLNNTNTKGNVSLKFADSSGKELSVPQMNRTNLSSDSLFGTLSATQEKIQGRAFISSTKDLKIGDYYSSYLIWDIG